MFFKLPPPSYRLWTLESLWTLGVEKSKLKNTFYEEKNLPSSTFILVFLLKLACPKVCEALCSEIWFGCGQLFAWSCCFVLLLDTLLPSRHGHNVVVQVLVVRILAFIFLHCFIDFNGISRVCACVFDLNCRIRETITSRPQSRCLLRRLSKWHQGKHTHTHNHMAQEENLMCSLLLLLFTIHEKSKHTNTFARNVFVVKVYTPTDQTNPIPMAHVLQNLWKYSLFCTLQVVWVFVWASRKFWP